MDNYEPLIRKLKKAGSSQLEIATILNDIPLNGHSEEARKFLHDLFQEMPSGENIPAQGEDTLTDVGNCERLIKEHGEKIRFNYDRNLWLIYNGKYWEWDTNGTIIKLAKSSVRHIYHEAAEELDEKHQINLAKHAKASQANTRIKGMVELAKADLSLQITDLNKDVYLLNVNNGTINLKTGELQPHNPDDLISCFIPLDYDPASVCPKWITFLNRIFDNNQILITYIQKSLGYSITGCQDEQAFWFNHGPGSNGKTTLIGAVTDILSDYAVEIDPMAFVLDKNSRSGPNESLASLYNKRFAPATEVKTTMSLDVALVKRMTGGEMIRCERKFEHGYNFKPTHKLWLSGNHEPRITDTTNSIWNRLKYIPFNVSIPTEERVKGLRSQLVQEEGAAILSWMVAGCLLWQKEGLGEPTEVIDAIQGYRDDQDILHDFLLECCILNKAEKIGVSELYKSYVNWSKENDTTPLGKKNFGNRLIEKGLKTTPGHANKTMWQGVNLVNLVNLVNQKTESSQENKGRIETSEKQVNIFNQVNPLATNHEEENDDIAI